MKKSNTNKMHHIQRKPSNETLASVGMDSTLDSRMSSTEVPQMELLKVNYVHQCKEALMTKTGSKPNYSYMEYKRSLPPVQLIPSQQQRGKNVARITVVNRYEAPNKPLPPLPPPTVESWQFLQNTSTPPSQKRTTNSPPKFVKPPTSSSSVSVFSDSSASCCHSSSCDTGCESDSTINGDVEKSNSWDYRNRIATCDIRRDIARAGIKSRADRIARIELTECEHGSPKSKEAVAKINKMFEQQKQSSRQLPPQPSRPAPVPHKEPNRRLKPLAPQPENQDRFRQSLSIKSSEECLECLSQQESEQEGSKRSQDSNKFVTRKPISRIPKPIQESRSSASHNRQEAFRYVDNEKTSVAETPPPSLNIDQNLLRNTRLPAGQYQKAKVERVHIRKKRQPLLIINQLNEPDDKRPEKAVEERDKNTCGYKNCNFSNCPMSRSQHDLTHLQHEEDQLKRLSLESNSDSGVSSSNDEHKKPLSSTTSSSSSSKVDNLKNLEKCSDIKKASEHFPPDTYAYDKYKLPKDYEDPPKGSHITIQVGKTSITSFSGHYNTANDPNDVTNFSKKNLTKATPNEALNNSITKSLTSINSMGAKTTPTKQCNIENEQRLKIQNNLQNNKSEKNLTKIKIDDDWIMDTSGEHHHHHQDEDFIEADSLMINEQMSPTAAAGGLKKPLNTGDNSVKIFVRSSGQNAHDLTRSSCISAHSFVSQTSVCTQNSTAHSTCSSSSCCSSASSASSSSSSGCSAGSHGGDNQSICDSERDCCCQFPDSNGIFFQRPSSVLSDDQRACAGSSLSSTDAISDISSCVTCSSAQSTVVVAPNANNSKQLACCQADSGVFWNNSYGCLEDGRQADEENEDLPCYCSMSSCDEDNCSYYEGETGNSRRDENQLQQHQHKGDNIKIEIKNSYRQEEEEKQVNANLRNPNTNRHQLQQLQHQSNSSTATPPQLPKRNARMSTGNQLLRKTDVIHELRPRSMDCAMDSGVSLNGDNGCNSDVGESQQDMEARRLKRGHVLTELLETERIYVSEMSSILKGYCDQMHSEEMMHLVPASLQGKEDILFGNLHELYTFHNDVFLKDLENCISTTELVALCFVQRRDTFYRLYSFYCQNIPRSDRLRETLVDTHLFLQECQKRLGHKLPLAAYLLKPVQRITKYQLLLKDLLRFSDNGSCTKELQKALDCMLIVLKCVNDSMHQVAITGFPTDLSQQGELLLQDSFQVWSESKKDIRLRIKPQQRHIFLYQKSMLFCKQTSKPGHNKSTYQFKHYLKMSQIGLTESVRGDTKRFEVWLQGRQEVHTLQAPTLEIKNKWVAEIKKVLLTQLEELKGEKIKQYGLNHRGLRQTTSWDTPNILLGGPGRTISCDASSESSNRNSNCSSSDDNCATISLGSGNSGSGSGIAASATTDKEHNNEACGWSSDYSNSEDEMSTADDNSSTPRFINFLAPWSTTTSTTTSTSNNTTTPHNGHHHNSNNHHNQNHNHHHHHNNHNQQLDNGSSYPRNTTNANKSNSKFYVSVEH
ncbi:rhoGEF domain-containing protein gxcJ isoform X3 [Musca domestica]|uniref:RhoGEF domain-containing protein gxcJ isoform X3 n=1 Tax=Musca domestica TaxID=7370 RepID=A0A9J7DG42_MUSDO|nr:rhoGEF domain-containing protein gxcJ isoform X3 [Musca domestica]